MEKELPVLVNAYEMKADYEAEDLGCTLYTTTVLGVDTVTAAELCTYSSFDFNDTVNSAMAWMSLW